MTRQRRLWTPGDILSVVVRAHEGRPLFATDDDREFVLRRIERILAAGQVVLLAWAILRNHFHLLLRVADGAPDAFFRRLNTSIAMRARRLRGDHGAMLQDRYWSRRCTTPEGTIAALTYVLGNPVHHGVVPTAEALESYRWSAYGEVLGLVPARLVSPERTLALLHPDPVLARASLCEAMRSRVAAWQAERNGTAVCEEPGCRAEQDGCRLVHVHAAPPSEPSTSAESPHLACPDSISAAHDERMDRRARLRLAGWRPRDLVLPVCARLGADPDDVASGRRLRAASEVRALIAHVACDGAGATCETLAPLLGVTSAAVSFARGRGRDVLLRHGWRIDEVLSWGTEGA